MWQRGRGTRMTTPSLGETLRPRQRQLSTGMQAAADDTLSRSRRLAVQHYLRTKRQECADAQQHIVFLQTITDDLATFSAAAAKVDCWTRRPRSGATSRRRRPVMSFPEPQFWLPNINRVLAATDADKHVPLHSQTVLRWRTIMQQVQGDVTLYNMHEIVKQVRALPQEITPFRQAVQAAAVEHQQRLLLQQDELHNTEIAGAITTQLSQEQQTQLLAALEQLPQDITDWEQDSYPNSLAQFRVWCRLSDTRDIVASMGSELAAVNELQQRLSTASQHWMIPEQTPWEEHIQILSLQQYAPDILQQISNIHELYDLPDLQQVLASRRTNKTS